MVLKTHLFIKDKLLEKQCDRMFRKTSPRYCKFAVVIFLRPLGVCILHGNNIISILKP